MFKNKKGLIGGADNFIFGMVGFFILILILVALVPVQHGDVTANQTIASINSVENSTLVRFATTPNNTVIVNILNSLLTFVIYAAMEVTKLGINYGLSHPEVINPITLLWLIILSLAIPIIFYLIKFIALIVILVREIIQSAQDRRNKKKYEELRRGYTK